METTVPPTLALRPDSAGPIQASATLDATSDATFRATSHAHSMSHANPNGPLATVSECDSAHATSGETCRMDTLSPVQTDDPDLLNEHPMLRLTDQQQQALELLSDGYLDKSVCKRVKIHRSTLARWKTTHPRFMAELARRTSLRQQSSNAAACRARDAALKIVLKHLRAKPSQSLDIAVRLLCSPQLNRLTASARPTGLQEIIAQLQSTRPSAATSADGLADLLQDLNAQVSVPEPPPTPPQPQSPLYQQIQQATAARHPRKDLKKVLLEYGCAESEIASLIRRPDLLPFDVHYYRFLEETPASPSLLISRLTNNGPAGITAPLSAAALHRLIERKLLPRFGYTDLAGARSSLWQDCLNIICAGRSNILYRPDRLWRDFVLGWSCEPQADSA